MEGIQRFFFLFLGLILITTGCNAQSPASGDSPGVRYVEKLSDSARNHERRGNAKAALHYHKRALQKSKEFGLPEQEARSLVSIARILKSDDARQSLEHLKSALVIAERINSHQLKADIFLAAAGIYKQQENYQEALIALEAHQKLLERIFVNNKAREIANAEADSKRKFERYIYLIVMVFIILVTIVLALYFFKTRRLNKALQSSNKIKDKLFSIIGHDLRGPAGGIMEALSMVDSGMLTDAEEKELIALLKKQSQSFNETLNTLLSWASSQLQGTDTQITSTDPRAVFQKVLNVLEGQARQKNIRINMDVPEKLTVLADPNHLEFIIRNLLSNAIKFSHENSTIDIVARREEKQVIISVADHGIGIPERKQKRFSALSDNMESSFGTKGETGTGLGLMLSKEFVLENKGRIWLKSTENIGTTFYLALQRG